MHKNRDLTGVEALLQKRQFSAAKDDLAEKIILSSFQIEQRQPKSILNWLRGICFEFHVMQPSFYAASLVVCGMVLGFAVSGNIVENASTSTDVAAIDQTFFDEGDIL